MKEMRVSSGAPRVSLPPCPSDLSVALSGQGKWKIDRCGNPSQAPGLMENGQQTKYSPEQNISQIKHSRGRRGSGG